MSSNLRMPNDLGVALESSEADEDAADAAELCVLSIRESLLGFSSAKVSSKDKAIILVNK